jgi:hypothetical protein
VVWILELRQKGSDGVTDDQIKAVAAEIHEYIKQLIKPWVDLRGHENPIAQIIRKHQTK